MFELDNVKNEGILRDFFIFQSWQHQKRSNSARLPQFAHFEVKMLKAPHAPTTLWRSDVVSRGRHKGLCTLSKVSKTWGFCTISKIDGRRGTFEEDLERCIFRGACSTRDMFIRAVRRSGRWFPEMGCILEHQIFRFAEMILRDRCSTSYDLASHFRGRRSSLEFRQMDWKNRKTHWYEAVSSALNFPFLNEVSQNCFVFDVVKFEKWRSLAELFRFWCCYTFSTSQLPKVVRTWGVFSFFTCKCASRQNGMHFFDISTSKSGPNVACF